MADFTDNPKKPVLTGAASAPREAPPRIAVDWPELTLPPINLHTVSRLSTPDTPKPEQ
jgi:hypothetical protein